MAAITQRTPSRQAMPAAMSRRAFLRGTAVTAAALAFVPNIKGVKAEETGAEPHGYFDDRALRLDFHANLQSGQERFTLTRMRSEAVWPEQMQELAKPLDLGECRLSVYDLSGRTLLFREGFNPDNEFSLRLPFPRQRIRAVVEVRDDSGATFAKKWSTVIDPETAQIDRRERPMPVRVEAILANGLPQEKTDVVIVGDGYQEAEYAKFIHDVRRATKALFSVDPFRSRKSEFNVSAVFAASRESGVTDPSRSVSKDTVLGCRYSARPGDTHMDLDKVHMLREVASAVPYDFILVLANASRSGGTCLFGQWAIVPSGDPDFQYTVVHEMGHLIGGLADEYYYSNDPQADSDQEPWAPNVTTTTSLAKLKWKHLVAAETKLPSPWRKAEYDASRGRGDEARAFFAHDAAALTGSTNPRAVGLFEGANRCSRGAYRSEVSCIMFAPAGQTMHFCKVCTEALDRMMNRHSRRSATA
jgi:IgA Peptidase M64/Peptidase M64 N-terminus